MSEFRAFLWCYALGKPVEVVLGKAEAGDPAVRHVPTGWKVQRCLDKGSVCSDRICPLVCAGEEPALPETGGLD